MEIGNNKMSILKYKDFSEMFKDKEFMKRCEESYQRSETLQKKKREILKRWREENGKKSKN